MPTTPPPTPSAPPAELVRKPWQTSTAPQYIALFLWVAYFDQIGRRTLPLGGLGPAVLGAAVAGVLCYLLLYRAPAMWGFRTGKPPTELGASTFGATGASWFNGLMVGLAQVVWFAVATHYATDLTFRGLVAIGLMSPEYLLPMEVRGLRLPNALFLFTSLTWTFAAAMTGRYLVRIIAALMNIFPIFMGVLLAVAMLWTLRGVPQFHPPAIDPRTMEPVPDGGPRAFLLMIELVFGFFAPAGALAADWGLASRTEKDVRLGGWVGVAFASWTVATLALLTVAGAIGQRPPTSGPPDGPVIVDDYSFHAAVQSTIGGPLAGTIFLAFGLASLAPACYASFLFGHRFAAAWPGITRVRGTLIGASSAWLLIAAGLAGRLETIFSLMGAVFGPVVAAMAADSLRQRGGWAGARRGINPPGLVAWLVGLAIGLVPIVAGALGWEAGARFQPAALFAFLAAFATYLALAGLGAESPRLPDAPSEPTPGAVGG